MTTLIQAINRVYTHPISGRSPIRTTLKLIWWMMNRYLFKHAVIVEMMPGAALICEPDSSYGSLVFYTGLPEYDEQMFMYNITHPSDIVVDIGAHIGSETVLVGSKITKGHIYSFEPTPHIYAKLQINCAVNRLENQVTSEQMAVSDKKGQVTFYVAAESEVNSLVPSNKTERIVVATTTLDNYAKQHKITHINLLKIDVEGAEYRVFRGAHNLLQHNSIDIIVFEVNDQGGVARDDNQAVQRSLKEFGYSLYTVTGSSTLVDYKPDRHQSEVHNVVAISPKLSKTKRRELGI